MKPNIVILFLLVKYISSLCVNDHPYAPYSYHHMDSCPKKTIKYGCKERLVYGLSGTGSPFFTCCCSDHQDEIDRMIKTSEIGRSEGYAEKVREKYMEKKKEEINTKIKERELQASKRADYLDSLELIKKLNSCEDDLIKVSVSHGNDEVCREGCLTKYQNDSLNQKDQNIWCKDYQRFMKSSSEKYCTFTDKLIFLSQDYVRIYNSQWKEDNTSDYFVYAKTGSGSKLEDFFKKYSIDGCKKPKDNQIKNMFARRKKK